MARLLLKYHVERHCGNGSHVFLINAHAANMAKRLKVKTEVWEEMLPSSTLLLISDDETLTDLVLESVRDPWKLVRQSARKYMSRKMFGQPNVRLVILDDQAVAETNRNALLAEIRKHFSGISLLYVAGSQSDGNERRARTNGAHYYISKPLSIERFGRVLQSFLQAQQFKEQPIHRAGQSKMNAKESTAKTRIASTLESVVSGRNSIARTPN